MLNKQSKDVTYCAKNNSNSEIGITHDLFEKLFLAHECENTKFLINYLNVTLLSDNESLIRKTIEAVSFTALNKSLFDNEEARFRKRNETYQTKNNVKFLPDIKDEMVKKGYSLTFRESTCLSHIVLLIQQSQNDVANYLSYRDTTLASVKEAFVTAAEKNGILFENGNSL